MCQAQVGCRDTAQNKTGIISHVHGAYILILDGWGGTYTQVNKKDNC